MKEPSLELRKTALIIIDLQKDMEADPSLGKMMRERHVIQNISQVLKEARQARMAVFHVKTVQRWDGLDRVPTVTDEMWDSAAPPATGAKLLDGTPGVEFIPELQPAEGDYVVQKRRSSAFYNTDLELLLRSRGVDTLLVTGVVTDRCVENTVRDARHRDFHTIVIEDCCAARSPEAHAYPMKHTFRSLGRVRTSQEMVKAISLSLAVGSATRG